MRSLEQTDNESKFTPAPPCPLCGQKVKGEATHRLVGLFDFLARAPFPCPLPLLALWGFPLSPLPMDFLNIDFLKGSREEQMAY